jgi:ribose 5-phosphate isomerase RpiB
MNSDGQAGAGGPDGRVMRWQRRVLTADDLRRNLNGHRELLVPPGTIITPMARDQIKDLGLRIVHVNVQSINEIGTVRQRWGYTEEQPSPLVAAVMRSLEREGLQFQSLAAEREKSPGRWARAVAECIARGECAGGVVFCQDPAVACCAANKCAGLRAVAIYSVPQAARAISVLAPNLMAVEMPGRTSFEIRQILRQTACGSVRCPEETACVLQELDGHAHR